MGETMDFRKDFLDGLGETVSKTIKDVSERANTVYESQKIRSRINAEQKAIVRLKAEIGTLVFSRFDNGEQFEGETQRLCEEIAEHLVQIDALKKQTASLRSKKICPSCKKEIPLDAQYCPACGTYCAAEEGTTDGETMQDSESSYGSFEAAPREWVDEEEDFQDTEDTAGMEADQGGSAGQTDSVNGEVQDAGTSFTDTLHMD